MSNIKIIHFLEISIFTPHFINSFDKISDNTEFYIINNGFFDKDYMTKDNVFLFDLADQKTQEKLIGNINNSEDKVVAIFHQLNGYKSNIIYSLRKDIRKVWCLWGNDVYETNTFLKFNLYEKQTKNFLDNSTNALVKNYFVQAAKELIVQTLLFINSRKKIPLLKKINERFGIDRYLLIKEKIDVISYIVPKEKEILSRLFPDKIYCHLYSDPQLPQFHHISVLSSDAENILVGNSGAITNNHLDCFEILKNCNLGARKIIVPLSYGGNENYINEVIKKGKSYFGESFIPMKDRVSLEEYSRLLSSCSIAMMNQRRQQAGGNLFHLVGSEVKVYMNRENGFYGYFKDNGIKVYDIDDFQKNFSIKEDLKNNYKHLMALYSEAYFQEQIKILLKDL